MRLITTVEGLPEAEAEAEQRSGAIDVSVKSTGSLWQALE